MKFNSLVVAAMVIASVNAGGRKKSAGGHRHNDGSGPSSEAVISRVYVPVPVVPSESASSRDFSEEEWAVLEGRDPISVQKVRDLKDLAPLKPQTAILYLANYKIYRDVFFSFLINTVVAD
ncbi:hypothetical protein BASA62_010304 [Batrachochytrium salamandrivorans]|nr:hypothetical protein BASA62_010304 [Batrachochytrium salamandrivorans]